MEQLFRINYFHILISKKPLKKSANRCELIFRFQPENVQAVNRKSVFLGFSKFLIRCSSSSLVKILGHKKRGRRQFFKDNKSSKNYLRPLCRNFYNSSIFNINLQVMFKPLYKIPFLSLLINATPLSLTEDRF